MAAMSPPLRLSSTRQYVKDTDQSSVILPGIADETISRARVEIIKRLQWELIAAYQI